jgi:ElaB/YqjD/DUF883 family membrane-anchored ribosome-binding protein
MSEEFEVKGPHEEVLEESIERESFGARLAVMTAIMATAGAILSYEAGLTLSEALMAKNEASIHKTEASDQWNFYQAKGNKENLAVLAAKLTTGEDRLVNQAEAKRYEQEKAQIKKTAESFEQNSRAADEKSEKYMHAHHLWATSTTAMQIGISLAAIALLTRRKWLQYASLACAISGLAIAFYVGLG